MSVIVTDMDMPERCHTCGLKLRGTCPRLIKSVSVLQKTRLEDCPLKSIDGLIEKITQLPTQENAEGQDIFQVYDVLRTIREYCEVSE